MQVHLYAAAGSEFLARCFVLHLMTREHFVAIMSCELGAFRGLRGSGLFLSDILRDPASEQTSMKFTALSEQIL